MDQNGRKTIWRAIRRGLALGVAVTTLWCLGWTTNWGGRQENVPLRSEKKSIALTMLRQRLGPVPGETRGLDGWGRRILRYSPILAQGEKTVLELRKNRNAVPQEHSTQEPPDHDDQTKPELQEKRNENIVEMTARGKKGGSYLWGNGVCLYNRTKMELGADVLNQGTVDVKFGAGPQILIVHTHGSESYDQSDGDLYEESDPYRTTDCTHNIVRVGEEIATVFRAHGFQVIHDTNLYDYPSYNGCYERSKAAVEQWLQQYPTIRFILDVHRDALVGKDGQIYKMVSTEAGEKVAQVMLVVGSNDAGFDHPRWRDNLALAVRLQQGLIRGYTDLARPIVLRSNRYNQQLLPGYLLVEVGGHGNTLTEAIAGARLWADNVARTLLELSPKP